MSLCNLFYEPCTYLRNEPKPWMWKNATAMSILHTSYYIPYYISACEVSFGEKVESDPQISGFLISCINKWIPTVFTIANI